jgi:hypothetical protein
MKGKLALYPSVAVLIGVAILVSEGWIYLLAAVVALGIILIINRFHSPVMKLTRWAKNNTRKAQLLITFLQVVILSTGLIIGYNLNQLGHHFDRIPLLVFCAVLCVGFSSTRFLPAKRGIALPVDLAKDRLASLAIALSSFAIMVVTGNRVDTDYPDTVLSNTLHSIDQTMFSEDNFSDLETGTEGANATLLPETVFGSIAVIGGSYSIHPGSEPPVKIKADKKARRFEKRFERRKQKIMKRIEALRKAFSTGASVGIIFLVILLVIACCAGICLALSGGGAGSVLLGIAILGLAIFGIVKLVSPRKVKPPKTAT